MSFIYLIFTSKIIAQLFSHEFQARYLFNHAEHPKRLVPYYVLPFFIVLKAYIKNNLANSFIQPFKSLTKVSIFFNKKPNRKLT